MSTQGPWKAVGSSMACGAAYDLFFAVAILFFTAPAAALLGLAVPEDPVYLRLNGIFLLILAAFYCLPALAPKRYSGVVVLAAGGRILGFLFFTWAWMASDTTVFLILGVADLMFGVVHGFLLWRTGRSPAQPELNTGA
ncbi:MAG: hypothetical protein IFK94_02185 [Acidobacteria bacterium]|uniref:Uncharacterized protein n=1 Tax=Candidatus Polarisedimenticola svalbardensis TaxID=2886004 RepID=A0A8J6XU34_9BACT|nr:hypothetical protein [Candidatus Polarisedimenticola svalbardensis]